MYRLRELRGKRSQKVFAELLGYHTTTYQRWEYGESELKFVDAIHIAKTLNVSLDYLAGLIDEPRKIY